MDEIQSKVSSLSGKITLRSRSDNNQESELVFEILSSGNVVDTKQFEKLNGILKVRTLNYSANN